MNINNQVKLIGRIANEELKAVPIKENSSTIIINFNIAISKWINKQIETEFLPVKAFGKKAEFIANHFSKGDLIAINGEIKRFVKQDENGNWKENWSILIDDITKLAKPKEISSSDTFEIKVQNSNNSNAKQLSNEEDIKLAAEAESDSSNWELKL